MSNKLHIKAFYKFDAFCVLRLVSLVFLLVSTVITLGCKDNNLTSIGEEEQNEFTYAYHSPSISPDGSFIAFIWNTRDLRLRGIDVKAETGIWIIDLNIGERQLVIEGAVRTPVVSNKGDRIAFILNGMLGIIQTDGNGLTLWEANGYIKNISWSPNDSALVIQSSKQIGRYILYLFSIDSGMYENLYGNDTTRCIHPNWHTNNNRIFFSRITTSDQNWIFGYINPENPIFIELDPSFYYRTFSIAKDVNRIVYEHDGKIWIRDIYEPNLLNMSLHRGTDSSIDSKGEKIAFIDRDPDIRGFSVIWTMSANGDNAQPITHARDTYNESPSD